MTKTSAVRERHGLQTQTLPTHGERRRTCRFVRKPSVNTSQLKLVHQSTPEIPISERRKQQEVLLLSGVLRSNMQREE